MAQKHKILSIIRENGTHSATFEDISFPVIGYSRLRSYIRNKPAFAALLKSVLSQ
jgi:hypothetical protein